MSVGKYNTDSKTEHDNAIYILKYFMFTPFIKHID